MFEITLIICINESILDECISEMYSQSRQPQLLIVAGDWTIWPNLLCLRRQLWSSMRNSPCQQFEDAKHCFVYSSRFAFARNTNWISMFNQLIDLRKVEAVTELQTSRGELQVIVKVTVDACCGRLLRLFKFINLYGECAREMHVCETNQLLWSE